MHLHEALRDIDLIRRQMARTETFDGFRALPTACGSVLATLAALAQPHIVPHPAPDLTSYLTLWIGVAAAAGSICAADAWRRHRGRATLHGKLTALAFEQFAPCVAAGALVTGAIAFAAPHVAWLLPGLWAVLFSLGLFASLRLLSRGMLVPAAWYLASGAAIIALGPDAAGFAPWTMVATFGVGQAAIAVVLELQTRRHRLNAEQSS